MPRSKRTQYKINHGKRKGYFQKSHPYFSSKVVPVGGCHDDDVGDADDSSRSVSPSDQWKRPPQEAYRDALSSMSSSCQQSGAVLPSRLRPVKPTTVKIASEDWSDGENIIVNVQLLTMLLQETAVHHYCSSPKMNFSISKRQGLCITGQSKCLTCRFSSSQVQLYETHRKSRGPETGTLNEALLLGCLKTKVGVSDTSFILSCLNVKAPDTRGMQRKLNSLCDRVEEINSESMRENQRYVRRVNRLAGREETEVDLETDTSYNNRPQAGFEAGTQSFSPLVENNTPRKLVLVLQTANKLCSKRSCDHRNCKKNYESDETIASSEATLVRRNLDSLREENILNVRSVTSDSSAQLDKTLRDYSAATGTKIIQYKCFIHKLRNLQKNIRSIKLKSPLPPGSNRDAFIQRLATCVRARVRYELVHIRKLCKSDELFIHKAEQAISNILPCFSGVHDHCRRMSFTCNAHLPTYSAKFLPYGRHLDLEPEDISSIQRVINKQILGQNLPKICRLSTTNKCESLHQTVFTYAPKNTTWARNFTALCHSAVHTSTHGTGSSSSLIANKVGVRWDHAGPFHRKMTQLDRLRQYHSLRKKTIKYKTTRHFGRKKKMNRKLRELSLYNNERENRANEHA